MRRIVSAAVLVTLSLTAQRGPSRRQSGAETFKTEVPQRTFDIVLGRPEARSVTATVLAGVELEGFFDYAGTKTALAALRKGTPVPVLLDRLEPNTRYSYRFHHRAPGTPAFEQSPEYSFHTQRASGSAFTFAVQADSHLDDNTDIAAYRQTLASMAAARPDFVIDLGDTFMTDKRRTDFRDALPQYLAQRYYFGLLCHSAPLFLVLGNHDGEGGARHDGSATSMAGWSHAMRTKYFPNPRPTRFYTGNTAIDPVLGSLENYYAWTWGDALFVVLDPYWPTTGRGREDNWHWTLGAEQYGWLKETLERSRAAFRFVFIHHPVGAKGQPIRGGIEAARYNEWGGRNEDGSDGFQVRRPGWEMPIHDLLVKNSVSVVFHGHDHFYAREQMDGVVYQLVPQPGSARGGAPRSADEYGYRAGDILGGAGYLRVRVSPATVDIEFVRHTGEVAHSYSLRQSVKARASVP